MRLSSNSTQTKSMMGVAAAISLAIALLIVVAVSSDETPAAKVKGIQITNTTSTVTTTTVVTPIKGSAPAGLGIGATGEVVKQIQTRLQELHYDIPVVNGTYDQNTYYAVVAFQKLTGADRTGRATDATIAALNKAKNPQPLIKNGEPSRVEVDIPRQVLLLWTNGQLNRILPVSTGGGYMYCVEGQCERAVTPGGRFHVSRQIHGIRTNKLGKLWNPSYFNRGIAIHGEPAVPNYPASHGCVRIPMYASTWILDYIKVGTPVYVIGGPTNTPAPFAQDPNLGQTTTTSKPAHNVTTTTKKKPTTTISSTTTVPATTTTL